MAALEAEHRSASRLLPRLEKPMKSSGSRQAVDSRRETGSTSGESVGPGQRAPEEEALRQPAAQAHGEGCDEEGMHLMPPPPPDPRAVVIEMLLVQGIPQAAAVRALRATDEAYSEAGIEQWAMAAIAWWTDQVDQERERAQLAEMMRISLEEAERRSAAVLPLHEWSDTELLAHFAGSALLLQLQQLACGALLLAEPLRGAVIRALEMERKCCKWFPTAGTALYFKALGAECASAAAACARSMRRADASCRACVAAPHPDPSPDLPGSRSHPAAAAADACGAGAAHAADGARSARGGAAAARDRPGSVSRPLGAPAGAASAAAVAGWAAPGEDAMEAAGPAAPGAKRRAKRGRTGGGAAAAAPRKSARVAAMDAVSSGAGCGARPQSQGAHGPSQTPTEPFAEHSEDTWEAPLPPTQVDDPAGASQEPPGRSSGAAGAGALSRAAAAGASGRAEGVAGEDADGCAEQAAAAAEALAALLVQKVAHIEAEAFKMPTQGGQVPAIFAALEPPPAHAESTDTDELEVIGELPAPSAHELL